MSLATQRIVVACFCAAALAAVGCADRSLNPVSPSASPAVSSLAATGKFTHFHASVDVTPPTDGVNWHWTGTYSFDPRD